MHVCMHGRLTIVAREASGALMVVEACIWLVEHCLLPCHRGLQRIEMLLLLLLRRRRTAMLPLPQAL